MNKKEFINKLSEEINYSLEDTIKINNIIEKNFIISKKNKDKITNELTVCLNIDKKEAERIYDAATKIIIIELKQKIAHPFKSKD